MQMDKEGIPEFEAVNWEKWKRAIQIYILAKNIGDDTQKQAILLHKGGQELQDIFFALPSYNEVPDNKTTFQHTLELLDNHFAPKINPLFERFTFRKLKQEENEPFSKFVARLRTQAAKCKFSNSDAEICDQIVGQCSSVDLRKKLLEQNKLKLTEVCEIAKMLEAVTLQSKEFAKDSCQKEKFSECVNKVVKSADKGKVGSDIESEEHSIEIKDKTKKSSDYSKPSADTESEEPSVEIDEEAEKSSDNSKSPAENYGPDQILRASDLYTSKANGRVTLRMEPGADITPISVPGLMSRCVKDYGDLPALSYKSGNEWANVTYKQYEKNVRIVAKAFLKLGLKRHHGVGILGFNSPEWVYSYLGAIYAGGFSAGIYSTNEPEACFMNLNTSKANIAVVEDSKQLQKILSVKSRLPDLEVIIQYKGKPTEEGVLSWEDVMEHGSSESDEKLNAVLKSMGVNECCTLVFTSGTEGAPKAVMLSHDNLIFNAYMINNYLPVVIGKESIVSFLPLSHVAAQITDIYLPIIVRGHVYFADQDALKNTLVDTLKDVRPTVFIGVPRVWEKIKDKLVDYRENSVFFKRYIAYLAETIGLKHYNEVMKGTETESYPYQFFRWLLFDPLKTAIGLDQTKVFITAAAPIAVEVKRYFLSVDIPLTEAFGMSECSGAHAICNPIIDKNVAGVGKTLKGAKSQICEGDKDDGYGELCIFGRHVFMGYLGLPEKTQNTIDSKGWLHTGDLAKIDVNGFVTITGRKKELLITAGGENVPPVYIENNVKAELPVISNAFLIGDKQKFLSILLSLKCEINPKTTAPTDDLTPEVIAWLSSLNCSFTKVSEVVNNKPKEVFQAIQNGINNANKKAISSAQKVQKFALLPVDFSMSTGELSPTLKVKRTVVNEKYKDLIAELYKN